MLAVIWTTIERVFSNHPQVVAAWVFGSAQDGYVRQGSDLDIGVLFAHLPTVDAWADLRADLQQAVGLEDIDLVVLNRANPVLRFEAVSGYAVYCRDAARRAEFVSLAAREYEDEMAWVQRALVRA